MTRVSKRIALAGVAGLLAFGILASVVASAQNTNPTQGSFSGQQAGPPAGPPGPGGRGGFGFGPGPMGLLRMFGPRLNLTDAQREQLKSIAEAHRTEWQSLAERGRTARRALADAVTADTLDEGLVRAKAADVAAVEVDMAVASARTYAEAWQILTPEQQAQAKQLRTERQNRMKERRGAMRQRIGRFLGFAQ
jgi:Spy/CpxP family protein refolding chaperone